MICAKLLLIFALFNQVTSSAIPIWERLTRHEKIGNLTFIFLQLVHLYCKHSDIPDCEKVLTLYGVSNLLKEDEAALDLLDPYQRNSRDILWRAVMSGAFDLPIEDSELTYTDLQTEFERDFNTISNAEMDTRFTKQYDYEDDISERYPYAVRVPAPPHFRNMQSGTAPSENQNRPKTLQNSSPGPSYEKEQQRFLQPQSYQKPASSTVRTRRQNSPVISIIPHVHSPSGGAPSPSRRLVSHNSLRSSSLNARNEPRKSNTLYILPSDKRQDPILLRILDS